MGPCRILATFQDWTTKQPYLGNALVESFPLTRLLVNLSRKVVKTRRSRQKGYGWGAFDSIKTTSANAASASP